MSGANPNGVNQGSSRQTDQASATDIAIRKALGKADAQAVDMAVGGALVSAVRQALDNVRKTGHASRYNKYGSTVEGVKNLVKDLGNLR